MKIRNAKLLALALAAVGFVSTANLVQAGAGIFGSAIGLKAMAETTPFTNSVSSAMGATFQLRPAP